MLIPVLMAAQALAATAGPAPECRAAQLQLTLDARDGDFNGMSHSGVELVIRNKVRDCMLPALPTVTFLDARGRALAVQRQAPIGMHPGPVMMPVRLAGGTSAGIDLRWVSGPAFPTNRVVRPARVSVKVGSATVRTTIKAALYGEVGKPVLFQQTAAQTRAGR